MERIHTIYSEKRQSGIPLINNLTWGTNFCQFYETENGLFEIVIPYLKAGLENNEYCIFVPPKALNVKHVSKIFENILPDFNGYLNRGQVEIIPEESWLSKNQGIDEAIFSGLDQAILSGYDGLRLACNGIYGNGAVKADDFRGMENISRFNIISLFYYPGHGFDTAEIMETARKHRFALVWNTDHWELIESTGVRNVEDALRRSEENLSSLFNNMSEAFAYHRIVLNDRGVPCDYIFLEVNESFENFTGLKREDILGKRVTEVLPGIENDPADWIGKYGQVALTGKQIKFENYSGPLDKWYSVSAYSPHKGYFSVIFSDITERVAMEKEVQHSKEEWELTFNTVPDMIALLDKNHQVQKVNRAMAERLGMSPEQCIGLHCYEIVHGMKEAPEYCPHCLTCCDGEEHVVELHEPRINGDFLVSTTAMYDIDSQIIGTVHVARDISALKKAEQELRRARDELEDRVVEKTAELQISNKALMDYAAKLENLNKELQDFAFVAAHDLQEPLRKIQTFSDIILMKCGPLLDSAGKEYLQKLIASAGSMRKLLRDLFRLSRAAQKPELDTAVDLDKVFREAIKLFEEDFVQYNASIEINNLPVIKADETQMLRLFQNLIGNALKYRGKENLNIRISSRYDGDQCEISVRDNGIGFDQRYADQIFKPFRRLHTKDDYEGSGIGLAICRKITESHGGTIIAEGNPGKGSTFIVRLPMIIDNYVNGDGSVVSRKDKN